MKTLETVQKPVFSFPVVFYRIFKFLASLKLAIFILAALMSVLAAGTIVESLHGTEAARLLVYDSPWFSLILFVLGVNVAAAALDRLPWKKKHTGFVITHIGIIMILAGSFMTRSTMIDGQMAIAESETEYRITLPEPQLFVISDAGTRPWIFSLGKHPFAWNGRLPLEKAVNARRAPFPLFLLSDYPKARMRESVETSPDGPPALQLKLKSSFVQQTQWLLKDDPALGNVQMGPAKFRFTGEHLKETAASGVPEADYLEFQFEKNSFNFPIPLTPPHKGVASLTLSQRERGKPSSELPSQRERENSVLNALSPQGRGEGEGLSLEFPIENTPYRVKILRLLKKAIVIGKELKEDDAEKASENPAAELAVYGENGFVEKHTVFAKFPDFPTVHGLKPSQIGVKVFYRTGESAGSRGQSHELRFVEDKDGLVYQIQKGMEVKTGKAVIGEETPLGWMDMKFKIETYYPHAQVNRRFSAQPETSQSEEDQPAVQIEAGSGNEKKQFWLRQGDQQEISLNGGETYRVIYGQKRMPAGFKLTLKDFRVQNYPGTDRPASFESDVTLKDDMTGFVKDATISMNKPLIHNGFYIYQSGYSLPEGGSGAGEVSIFSVGRDPGVPVKYGGAIVMVLGTLTMFYTRRFSSTAGKMVG